ncbi:type A chloramphenicol O-acetyltransferase [Thermoactinomyces vulgaris]|jgi:chloramphenicol O-acetyltransferase type A|nr:type A chloramphenicol O-acetyltransferase [Thermoactinomyces vulgaris]QCV55431.1 type A chloramphenicol O-acetyltransferase [Thermoactinomyces vulgaris]
MNFHKVNWNEWERKKTFHHFLNQQTTFSMTTEIDITALYARIKQKGFKFYPVFLYVVTRVVNSHPAFRMGYNHKREFGCWDQLHPLYTIFDRESEMFSGIWTMAEGDFKAFYRLYLTDVERYGGSGKLFPKTPIPENAFSVSMIPWTSFTGFNLNIHNQRDYLLPIVTAGKWIRHGRSIRLPVALQVHHAVCDGYHAGMFMNAVQEWADHPEEWL